MFHRVCCLLVLLPLASACQPPPRRIPDPYSQPQAGSPSTLQGVISSVERPVPDDSRAYVHVVLTPFDRRPVRLVLAPGWYLEEQGLRLAPDDSLRVEGRRVVGDGGEAFVVKRVHHRDRDYDLRDDHDQPKWEHR